MADDKKDIYDDLDTQDKYVMYKDREEWSDLKPIQQNDGPHPVVKIAYSDDFVDVYDYFRGVVAVRELSERALHLTEDAIHMNAANYTVWQYRRRIIEHLHWDLQKELVFCKDMIESNPKNYQVWHHRRVIVDWLGDGRNELSLTKIIFSQDAKNYHAWEHRQWALRTFGLYDGELEFTENLLKDDVRNNSAWNHRYFVIARTSGFTVEVLKRELLFVKDAIEELADNESPWSYMQGLLNDTLGEESVIEDCWRDVEAWCWKLLPFPTTSTCSTSELTLSDLDKGSVSSHVLVGILDCCVHRAEQLRGKEGKNKPLETALQLCDILANTHDAIRCKYWQYFARELQQQNCFAHSESSEQRKEEEAVAQAVL